MQEFEVEFDITPTEFEVEFDNSLTEFETEFGIGGIISPNYELATNKPSINGVELVGNKTTEELGIKASSDYNDLPNKPSINGVELTGDKTTEELGIEVDVDYNNMPNKPSINGVELTGDKTTDDLGITNILDEGNYFNSDNIEGALQEIGEKLGICIVNAGQFNDYDELNAYPFKNDTFYVLKLSGGLAQYNGAYICYINMFAIGSMVLYKYIYGYNLQTSQSITVDLVKLEISVNQIEVKDENKYFSSIGLDSVLQEIGEKLTYIYKKNVNLFDKNIELVEGYTVPAELNFYENPTEPAKTVSSTTNVLYNAYIKIKPSTKYIVPLTFRGVIGLYSGGGYRYQTAVVRDDVVNGFTKTESGYVFETDSEEYMCVAFDKNAEINFDEFMIVDGTGLFVGSRLNREIKLLKEQVIGLEEIENKTKTIDNVLQDILKAIQEGGNTSSTIAEIEQLLVSYFESQAVEEVEAE